MPFRDFDAGFGETPLAYKGNIGVATRATL